MQKNYSTFVRECLVFVSAVEHFLDYLLNFKFQLRNEASKKLFSKKLIASALVS